MEQAFYQFFQQWHDGLQPTLHLSTLSNGAVCVRSEVVSLPYSSRNAHHSTNQSMPSSRTKSRQRRKAERAKLVNTSEVMMNANGYQALDSSPVSVTETVPDFLTFNDEEKCSLAEPSIENDNPAVTSISSVQFGDGNSEILAELKESQVAISESSSSTIKVQDVEDVNEIPIDKLTKEQFARYMDEIKAILTFHPSDFRLHKDVQPLK